MNNRQREKEKGGRQNPLELPTEGKGSGERGNKRQISTKNEYLSSSGAVGFFF